MGQMTWLWALFITIVLVSLGLDLFVFHRKARVIPVGEALRLSAFWIGLALVFAGVVYLTEGPAKGTEFLTAYLVEKSLSIDNIFAFLALLAYFDVPGEAQRKVLTQGVLGAIIFRGVFIFAGVALVNRFHFLIYVLGAFLIYAAIRLLTQNGIEVEPEKNPLVRLARKIFRVTPGYDGGRFLVRINGLLYATPLLIVLISVETTDIMFATNSIPAVLGITLDPLIVYTSNVFALLGIRDLVFAIAGILRCFRYLVYSMCLVLVFVGIKMLVSDVYAIPTLVSLGVVFSLIAISIVASIFVPEKYLKGKPLLANLCETKIVKKD